MSSSTRRSTPESRRGRRAVIIALTIAALVTGCSPAGDRVVTGRFGPDAPVALVNLTIPDGRYRVAWSLWLFVAPEGPPVDVTCSVVDASGRVAFFAGLDRTAPAGEWTRLSADGTFDLPEVTLGIRCFPERDAALELVVREVTLTAEPL